MNLGLIGKSLSHSFSKSYFERKFITENKLGYQYINFDLNSLCDLIDIIKQNQLVGINVTTPYKEAIIPFLNKIDDTALKIGAVNCVKIKWNNNLPFLIGYNTDYYGFSQSIKPFLEPIHQRALILGTGGASKAVSFALKNIGIDVYFVSKKDKVSGNIFNYEDLNEFVMRSFKLIVNCTPLGMYPNTDYCPNIPFQFLDNQHLLFDLIYNPEETVFLKKGKEKSVVTVNGLNMLKLQADKAWDIWELK